MLVDSGEVNEAKYTEAAENFYETSLEYINKWKCSLGNNEKFKWVLLRKTSEWKEIQDSRTRNSSHAKKQKKLMYSINGHS